MRKLIFASIIIAFFLFCEKSVTPPPDTQTVTIVGKVIDTNNILPISNAIVQAKNNQISDTTALTGEFRLDSILMDDEMLMVTAPGYLETQYSPQPSDDSKQIIISLHKDEAMSGYYLYAGNYSFNRIFVIDPETNLLSDTIENLPSGLTYFLIVNHDGTKLYANTA